MLQKPTSKTVMSSAMKVGAGVAGAKVSDGLVNIMPESVSDYKKLIVCGVSLLAAAAINPKTTAGEALQAALVGAGIKQGADALTDMLVPSVERKSNDSITNKFINGVIGHNDTVVTESVAARLSNPVYWQPENLLEVEQPMRVTEASFV